jgi:hypothetical protein
VNDFLFARSSTVADRRYSICGGGRVARILFFCSRHGCLYRNTAAANHSPIAFASDARTFGPAT